LFLTLAKKQKSIKTQTKQMNDKSFFHTRALQPIILLYILKKRGGGEGGGGREE